MDGGTVVAALSSAPAAVEMTADLLDIRNLSVRFPVGKQWAAAVDGVSLRVNQGRVLGLVGESGSGKSLTALSAMGLIPPPGKVNATRLCVHGMEMQHGDEDAWRRVRGRRVAVLFQEPMPALNPLARIGDQITEVMSIHGIADGSTARNRAVALLERVKIPDPARRAQSFPHQLSGGQRQRAMIAMALAGEPDLLIADEPTTALDVTVQSAIIELLREIKAERDMGMIFISHNLGLVSSIADDIAVMYAGRIVEHGATKSVLSNPAHPYTNGLISTVPKLRRNRTGGKRRLVSIEGTVPQLDERPPGCRFSPRCSHADERCRRDEPDLARSRSSARAVACWNPVEPPFSVQGSEEDA